MSEPSRAPLDPAAGRRFLRRPDTERLVWDRAPDRVLRIGGVATPLREAGPRGDREAVVFVHGNPGSSADWDGLLPVVAGLGLRAVAWDAPGFGRAVAPAGFPQRVDRHAAFVGRALDVLGIDRAHLVLHDFGGPWGLAWAAGQPQRFASAVLLSTGALPGYRWHALARLWRTPLLGELVMASATRAGFRLGLRRGQPRPLPRAFVDRMYADFDRATRRAVLELYRSVPDVAAAGARLAAALRPLDRPALVLWGRDDPYLGVEHAERQREAFPRADVRVLDDAGHWPFVDRPAAVAAALRAFLAEHARAAQRRGAIPATA
jgi:pimeloyl-ACP methyl ester carboxylesterase